MNSTCYFDKVLITFIVETDGRISGFSTEIPDDTFCMEASRFAELKKQLNEGLWEYLNEMSSSREFVTTNKMGK